MSKKLLDEYGDCYYNIPIIVNVRVYLDEEGNELTESQIFDKINNMDRTELGELLLNNLNNN